MTDVGYRPLEGYVTMALETYVTTAFQKADLVYPRALCTRAIFIRVVPRPQVSPVRWWTHLCFDKDKCSVRYCRCMAYLRLCTVDDIATTFKDMISTFKEEMIKLPDCIFGTRITGEWTGPGGVYQTHSRRSPLIVPEVASGRMEACMTDDVQATWTELLQHEWVAPLLATGYVVCDVSKPHPVLDHVD